MSKKKSYNFIINHGTYPFDLMVSIGESDEVLFPKLQKKLPDEFHYAIQEYASFKPTTCGRYVMFPNGASLLRLRDAPITSKYKAVLAHEIFHCVEFLFDKIGIKHDIDASSEAYAYQIEYLTGSVYDKIK